MFHFFWFSLFNLISFNLIDSSFLEKIKFNMCFRSIVCGTSLQIFRVVVDVCFLCKFYVIVLCSDLDLCSSFMINHFVFIFNSVDQ